MLYSFLSKLKARTNQAIVSRRLEYPLTYNQMPAQTFLQFCAQLLAFSTLPAFAVPRTVRTTMFLMQSLRS